MENGTRKNSQSTTSPSNPRKTLGGLVGLTIIIGLTFLWVPRLWFGLTDPAKLQELFLQTSPWMLIISVILLGVFAFLMQSAWELIKQALDD
jgi:hypothetical protein